MLSPRAWPLSAWVLIGLGAALLGASAVSQFQIVRPERPPGGYGPVGALTPQATRRAGSVELGGRVISLD